MRHVRQLFALTLIAAMAGCGDDGTSGGSGGAGGGGEGGEGAADPTVGCDGASLLSNPDDTSVPGPWPVGARSVTVDGLSVEVWYPATPGSEAGATPKSYDLRDFLPVSEQTKISDEQAPKQTCACFPDLPLDEGHGPYPVIVFVHGTAGYRAQSLELTQHWASRGFVVLAADHPGLYLAHLIESLPGCDGEPPARDLDADLATLRAAIESPSEELAFLSGFVDASRLGMTGHSAGGGAVANQGDYSQVIVPMAAGGVEPGAALESALVLGAVEDQVVDFAEQQAGFESTMAPQKVLVGISPAGHLVFSSLCQIENDAGEDLVSIGTDAGVCGLSLAGALFDCDAGYVDGPTGWTISNDASSAAFEQTLHCQPQRAQRLASLRDRYDAATVLEIEP